MLTAQEVFAMAYKSVFQIQAINTAGAIGTGTAFRVKNRIVTCAINLTGVSMTLGAAGPPSYDAKKLIDILDWKSKVRGFSAENSFDYAILDVDIKSEFLTEEGLRLSNRVPEVGEPVCSLGFSFEDPSLSIHHGIVASITKSGVATMLKLDMSVNPGNSGGPIISLVDGSVIAMTARKATGLNNAFRQLRDVTDRNIRELSAPRSSFVQIGGIDPMQLALLTQRQFGELAAHLERSSMVGIGYGIHVGQLLEESALEQ